MRRVVCTMAVAVLGSAALAGCGSPASAAGTATSETGTTSSRSAVGAAAASSSWNDGWYFVPIGQRYGDAAVIAGLSSAGDKLRLLVRIDELKGEGFIPQKTWNVVWFTPATGALQPAGTVRAQAQPTYTGPVQLSFSDAFPTRFQPVSVTVEVHGKPAAKWPTAIPMYGSDVNPESLPPGAWDNRILGQVGNWIWVALKGPQNPPLYPHSQPILWGFRNWDRLVAFNVLTGQAVEYSIPMSYGYGAWVEMETPDAVLPAFARAGDHVLVAFGEWVGCFPAVPDLPKGAPAVVRGTNPIRRAASAPYVNREARAALSDLQSDERDAAQMLASYWDSQVGVQVQGVPPFRSYQTGKLHAWNQDPAIVNHGDLPPDLLWALRFPYPAGSPLAEERDSAGRAILAMLNSPLQQDAYGIVQRTAKQVVEQFHGHPPMSLPGYVIHDNVYVPEN
ncbi:MAG: hypothetical protein K6T30_08880 [Alicyclobacillus sp.]|nr:hypothetical protein [Alicyclobacillus sp.]